MRRRVGALAPWTPRSNAAGYLPGPVPHGPKFETNVIGLTGCLMIWTTRERGPEIHIFRAVTARRAAWLPGSVGVLPQNGLRQEHRQDRRARML